MKKMLVLIICVIMLCCCYNKPVKPAKHIYVKGYISDYQKNFRNAEFVFKNDSGYVIPFNIDDWKLGTIEGGKIKVYQKNHTHLYVEYTITYPDNEDSVFNGFKVLKELNK